MFSDYKLSSHLRYGYPDCVNTLTWKLLLALITLTFGEEEPHVCSKKVQFNRADVKTSGLFDNELVLNVLSYSGDIFT